MSLAGDAPRLPWASIDQIRKEGDLQSSKMLQELHSFCWLQYRIRDLSGDRASSPFPNCPARIREGGHLSFKHSRLDEPVNPFFRFDLRGGILTNGRTRCPRNFEQTFPELALSVSNKATAQASALNAFCLMILDSSDSWRVENCFRGSVMA
jgi:hypothetical protein